MGKRKDRIIPYGKSVALTLCLGLAGLPQALVAADTEVSNPEIELSEVSAAPRALVGDQGSGEKIYRRNCRACHGATAKGASSFPKLVGKPTDFLIDRIARYRAGEKFGPNTPLMAQRVQKLKDQDIANVVAFISSLDDG